MVTAGIHPMKLIIKHQRNPRQRVPEFGISCAESPTQSVQRNSGREVTVLRDINIIIEIDEVELIHLPENSKCNNSQNDIND
jgi:hypothetical protein